MVRSYKRKTVNKYSEEMLCKAINNVQAKKLSMRKASVRYSVSKIFRNYFIISFACTTRNTLQSRISKNSNFKQLYLSTLNCQVVTKGHR